MAIVICVTCESSRAQVLLRMSGLDCRSVGARSDFRTFFILFCSVGLLSNRMLSKVTAIVTAMDRDDQQLEKSY